MEFTYYPVLATFNNLSTIKYTNKTTPSKESDDILKVIIGDIIKNMTSLVQRGNYGTISTIYP